MAMYPPPPQAAGPPATGNASGPRAGFWRRFAGLLIDGILLSDRGAHPQGDPPAWEPAPASTSASRSLYFTVMIGGARGQTLGQMAMESA